MVKIIMGRGLKDIKLLFLKIPKREAIAAAAGRRRRHPAVEVFLFRQSWGYSSLLPLTIYYITFDAFVAPGIPSFSCLFAQSTVNGVGRICQKAIDWQNQKDYK